MVLTGISEAPQAQDHVTSLQLPAVAGHGRMPYMEVRCTTAEHNKLPAGFACFLQTIANWCLVSKQALQARCRQAGRLSVSYLKTVGHLNCKILRCREHAVIAICIKVCSLMSRSYFLELGF